MVVNVISSDEEDCAKAAQPKSLAIARGPPSPNADLCAICFDCMARPDRCIVTFCHHKYHMRCMEIWFQRGQHSCPRCRREHCMKTLPGNDGKSIEPCTRSRSRRRRRSGSPNDSFQHVLRNRRPRFVTAMQQSNLATIRAQTRRMRQQRASELRSERIQHADARQRALEEQRRERDRCLTQQHNAALQRQAELADHVAAIQQRLFRRRELIRE
eukprot:TRINITY_DN84491_c0_g1_i1.p1 TRINITY_DN84491_c0_g1~~TRINITY_DN84491_c0_g1_i1.p1  ORF type:complete len:214 (-),score=22.80 TRINITY_DN84491_c0_g1_i1:267-908(-)